MGLSGSQVAYRLAIADVGRADATRAGYFLRNVVPVSMNGSARTGVIQQSIRIDLNTGEEPHRCAFTFRGGAGYVPLVGHVVVIGHGSTDNELFEGRLTRVTRRSVRNADTRPLYDCDASGWVFDLNIARVQPGFAFTSIAPRSIIGRMFSQSEPVLTDLGFAYPYVDATLPYVAEFSVGPVEPIAQAMARLFRSVDATWYIDHKKQLHAYGTTDPESAGVPATLTSDTSAYWGLSYTATDASRVFAHVQVLGQLQTTLADVAPATHKAFPLTTAEGLYDGAVSDTGSAGAFASWDGSYLVGSEGRYTAAQTPPIDRFQTPESHMRAGKVSTFLPASANANTITVAAANVSSMSPLVEERWYNVAGQWLYVASVLGAYSLTANSVAYHYYVPSSMSGAIVADIEPPAEIAPTWNFVPNALSFNTTVFPAGTKIQIMAEIVGNSPVGSLVANSATAGDPQNYALALEDTRYWTRTYSDERLSPKGARQVASEALQRGAPSAWQGFEVSTRERYIDIGRPVYVAVTSVSESSGQTFSGAFTAQDVSIGEFGRLTETHGPVRTVTAGTVRRPTLWQVLQGD